MQKCFVSLKVLQLCGICFLHFICRVFLVGQMVKNRSAKQETWIQPLGWEDPLEEGMAAHSSVPAWRIPWAEEPGGLQPMGSQKSQPRLGN